MYITNPDLTFSERFVHSRLSGQLPFILSLEMILSKAHDMPLEYTKFGKPSKETFDYAAEIVKQ